MSRNFWEDFQREHCILSRVPVLRHWAFGCYVHGYCDLKSRLALWDSL